MYDYPLNGVLNLLFIGIITAMPQNQTVQAAIAGQVEMFFPYNKEMPHKIRAASDRKQCCLVRIFYY